MTRKGGARGLVRVVPVPGFVWGCAAHEVQVDIGGQRWLSVGGHVSKNKGKAEASRIRACIEYAVTRAISAGGTRGV